MKIGIVTTWFERGAAYVSKQFKDVWKTENEVFIYARGGESVAKNQSEWQTTNITYGKRYKFTTLDLIDINHFKKWIIESDLDIVFFNEQHMWKPVLACVDLGVTIGSYVDYYTEETIQLFGIYDFLICNTKRHFSVFEWHPQVFYIPWGTDIKIYNHNNKKKTENNQLIFFHSAGMNPYRKGTDLTIRSFYNLKSDISKLLIHTQVNLIKFFPELTSSINELIKNGRLEIIEKTVTAPGLYHKGDIYVYPSRLEGIGLTIAEASASGMPVLTTNEAPMNEFIEENINGKLIDVNFRKKRKDNYYWKESIVNTNHLTTLMKFYEDNLESLESFKAKSLIYSHSYLDWDKNSKQLLTILKKIKPIKNKKEIVEKIKKYEKKRSLKFYIATSIPYQILKTKLKSIRKRK